MFSTFLQELRGYLGKGFLLAVFVPTMLFWGGMVAVYLAITVGFGPAWQYWTALSAEGKIILLLVGLLALSFFAYVIHNFQLPITRLFEGYWHRRPLVWLLEPRRRRYLQEWQYLRRRVADLEQAVQQARAARPADSQHVQEIALETELAEVRDRWLTFFPPPSQWQHIRPTRLGNVLRAGELYARDHYGLDAVILWTRLRPLLQGSIVDTLQDKKIAMDFMLLMAAYAGFFTLFWCPILALFTNRWLLFAICAAGLPLASICYQNAVQNALAYSEQIRAVFDLHRHELLKAMGLKIPTEPESERQLWEDLSLFFHNNIPPTEIYQYAIAAGETHQYVLPEAPPPAEPKGWARIYRALRELRQGIKELLIHNGP